MGYNMCVLTYMMVCESDLGRQQEEPQPQQLCDKWNLSSKEG